MVDSDLGLTLVFNGCIYNYQELRTELEAVGYRFFSTSDTEVVLKAFHRWGTGCVDRFKGMFAFAIADRDTGVVSWPATGSASSRCTWPRRRDGCASPRPCPPCSPPATSTPSSTGTRCTTT